MRSARLVGRDGELAAVERLFELGIRLVTLVGAPGIGKSALAEAVAERSSLWSLDRPVMRVSLGGARDDDHALELVNAHAALSAKAPHMMMLDDVENVMHAARSIASAALAAAPDTLLIVTSRAPLGIPGEHAVEVGPLSVRREGDAPSAAAAMVFARTAAWRPLEDWAADQREAVERLVADVDGIPLALEIIAARLRTMDVPNAIASLSRPDLVLTSLEPSLTTRFSSMSSALTSSWTALSDEERTDLAAAATFARTFRLEDAEAVMTATETPVLARLLALRDKHLVRVSSTDDDGAPAFSLFATTRAFVRSRAREIAEATTFYERHDSYFLARVDKSSMAFVYTLESAPEAAVFEDVLEAVDRMLDRCDPHDPVQLEEVVSSLPGVAALALDPIAAPQTIGRFDRASALVTMASADSRARFWLAWGTLRRFTGEPLAAEKCFEASREAAELPELRLLSDIARAAVLVRTGRTREADAALARPLSGKETPVRAEALRLLAAARAVDGRPQEAELLAREAFRSHIAMEHTPRPAFVILLCALLSENGRFAEARAHLESARSGFAAANRWRWVALCDTNLGSIAFDEGHIDVAIERYSASFSAHTVGNDPFEASLAAGYGGASLLVASQPARACDQLERAVVLSDRSNAPDRGRLFRALLAVAVAHGRNGAATAERAYALLGRVEDSVEQGLLRDAVNILLASKEDKPLALRRAGASVARITSLPGESFVRRVALRVLEAVVREESRRDGRVLRLASDGSWFETSTGRVDLSTRVSLRRLLLALAASAQTSPGALVTAPELIGAGWPGERILPSAARGRLRVAMCTLRKLGLREFLASSRHGHALESRIEMIEVAPMSEAPAQQTA